MIEGDVDALTASVGSYFRSKIRELLERELRVSSHLVVDSVNRLAELE